MGGGELTLPDLSVTGDAKRLLGRAVNQTIQNATAPVEVILEAPLAAERVGQNIVNGQAPDQKDVVTIVVAAALIGTILEQAPNEDRTDQNSNKTGSDGGTVNPQENQTGGEQSQKDTVTVYRGVGETTNGVTPNPAYKDAEQGRAVPRGGTDGVRDPDAHNGRAETENSAYTSWTTDRSVAVDHATKNGDGIVLTDEVDPATLTPSKDGYYEKEVLREGVVEGATPEKVRGM